VVWQEPVLALEYESVQVDVVNEPPAPLSPQEIEPGGEEGVELVSVTVAV